MNNNNNKNIYINTPCKRPKHTHNSSTLAACLCRFLLPFFHSISLGRPSFSLVQLFANVFLSCSQWDCIEMKKKFLKICAIEEVNKFSSTIFCVLWPHCAAHSSLEALGWCAFTSDRAIIFILLLCIFSIFSSFASFFCCCCCSSLLAIQPWGSQVLALWLYLFFPLCA